MNKALCMAMVMAAALSAQDAALQPQAPVRPPESPAPKAVASPKVTPSSPVERPAKRRLELERREAHADKLAGEARAEKRRAIQEKAVQTRLRRAEAEEVKKADKAKQSALEAQQRADAHRRKAEEHRKKAEASWKAYQATLKPAGPAKARKEEEKAAIEAPKQAEGPK